MKIAVVTDTNSGITVEEAKALGVYLVHMPIIVDGISYLEGVDMTHEILYTALEEEKKISSSQPSLGDIEALWTSLFGKGYDEILYIPMSSSLSSSYQSAKMLAEEFEAKVYVVNNRRISATQRESVLEAKAMVDAGYTTKSICTYLEETAYEQSIYLTVSSLDQLKKGGRLSASAATLGTLLNIKPVLSIQGGQIDVIGKVRGIKNSQKKVIEALKIDMDTRFSNYPKEHLRLYTAGTIKKKAHVEQWVQMVQEQFPTYDIFYFPLPCSVASHVGTGCMGAGVVINKPIVLE